MQTMQSLEDYLERALEEVVDGQAPPRLHAALRHALLSGGRRWRPRLCLAVATACGAAEHEMAYAAAAAVEFVHCASLVHDDLPCFDDAATRRGKPSVHAAYGEELAVLAGDALIVHAFELLARAARQRADVMRLPQLIRCLAAGTGAGQGIIAGQALESEPALDIGTYHQRKTGALFAVSACMGALVAGFPTARWEAFANKLGEAYQAADDLNDVLASSGHLGKPVGQDASLGRPNVAIDMGVDGAKVLIARLVDEALLFVPRPSEGDPLRAWVRSFANAVLPQSRVERRVGA